MRIVMVSVLITDETPNCVTADFSVNISRGAEINAKGVACRVGLTVWRLVGIICVQFIPVIKCGEASGEHL